MNDTRGLFCISLIITKHFFVLSMSCFTITIDLHVQTVTIDFQTHVSNLPGLLMQTLQYTTIISVFISFPKDPNIQSRIPCRPKLMYTITHPVEVIDCAGLSERVKKNIYKSYASLLQFAKKKIFYYFRTLLIIQKAIFYYGKLLVF